MLGRQKTAALEGERLLQPHHDGVGKAAQQHHHRQQRVHDADSLVVDAGDPFAPEIGQVPFDDDPAQDGENAERDHA